MPGWGILAAHSLTCAFLDSWLFFGVGWFLINFGLVFLSPCVGLRAEQISFERGIPLFPSCPCSLLSVFTVSPYPREDSESQDLLVWPSSYFSWRQWLSGSNIELGLDPALIPWTWALIIILSVEQEFTHNVQGSCVPICVCTTLFTFDGHLRTLCVELSDWGTKSVGRAFLRS